MSAYRHIMFDIETTDVESSAAVLSIALIEFKLDEVPVFENLLKRAVFVKFNVEEQIRKYHRTVDPETMKWWSKRPLLTRQVSLTPKETDLSVEDGIAILRDGAGCDVNQRKNQDVMFWARGSLDQVVFESLCRSVGQQAFSHYSNWRDVRTAVELLAEGAVHGYVEVPGCPQDSVHKHDPIHDCAYDIMQLLVNNISKTEE